MNIFDSLDHREILDTLVKKSKDTDDAISFVSIAELAGVQRSYVSRVMKGEANWSSDQVYLLTTGLKFKEDEAEYFSLLVESERTGLESRRKALQKQIKSLRRKHLRSHKVLEAESLVGTDMAMAEYFADPYHSLVHVYLSLPKYQKNMNRLAKAVGLQENHLVQILERLEKLEVVRYHKKEDWVEVRKPSLNTPAESHLVHGHQALFRAFSLDRFARCAPERKNTYSAVFSGDVSLQETLWAEFLKYLKRIEAEATNSRNANEVFYLQFDLFPWNGGEH